MNIQRRFGGGFTRGGVWTGSPSLRIALRPCFNAMVPALQSSVSMNLAPLLVTLIVLGLVLYLVETYIPMSPPIKTVLRVVVVVVLVLWLLQTFLGVSVPILLR